MGSPWRISETQAAERERAVARAFLAAVEPLLELPVPSIRAALEARGWSLAERKRLLVIVRRQAETDPDVCACLLDIDAKIGDAGHVRT